MSETRVWMPMHDQYRQYLDQPQKHAYIWLQRQEWPEPQKADPRRLDAMMNAIGLFWTPVLDPAEPAPNLLTPSLMKEV